MPSGAERLTCVAPMVPVAPALLSTRKGWPSVLVRRGAMARATMSVEPPAGNGTTSVTGLVGQVCANAPFAARTPHASAARIFFMTLSPGFGWRHALLEFGSATLCS